MRYDKWKIGRQIQNDFQKALYKLTDIFGELANSSKSTEEYQSKMFQFQASKEYNDYILSIVRRMVTPLSVGNMRTWREASRQSARGNEIYRALMSEINEGLKDDLDRIIEENASLIRTLPTDTADKVVRDVFESALKGKRASEIAKEISKYTKKHSRASARLIARTEVSKTSTALTKARCKNININWYVWRTMQDGLRVRVTHRIMEGVLINWDDPPSPEELDGFPSVGRYHAGEIWNCRCYSEPLLDIDDVHWPHKVYMNGRIQTMRKNEFEKLLQNS